MSSVVHELFPYDFILSDILLYVALYVCILCIHICCIFMSYLCRIIIMYTVYTFQKLHKRLTFLACEYLNYMYANVFWISAIVIVKHSNTNLKTVDYFDMFFL